MDNEPGVRLDAYLLLKRLPSASSYDAWRARDRAGGQEVLVHVLPLPADVSAREVLLARAAECRALVGPHVARCRDVVVGEHALAMVHDLPPRSSAAAPGAPGLEKAIAAVADAGFGVADADGSGAWVTANGRVVVVPLPLVPAPRLEPIVEEGAKAAAAETEAPSPVSAALEDRVVSRRREKASFVERPTTVRRALVLLGVVGVAVGAGLLWSSTGSPPQGVTVAEVRPTVINWVATIESLDEARAAGFAEPDPARVVEWAASGSQAAESDAAVLADLAARGVGARGMRPEVELVDVVRANDVRAVLRVTDTRPAYDVVDAAGVAVEREAARGSTAWTVELVKNVKGQWRIDIVMPQ